MPENQESLLPYKFISAWSVIGGVNVSDSDSPQQILRTETVSFALTTNPDQLLFEIDRKNAVANLRLRAIFNNFQPSDINAEIEKTIEKLQANRNKPGKRLTYLITEIADHGPIDLSKTTNIGGIIFGIDAADNTSIKARHFNELESIRMAIGLLNGSQFEPISDGVFFQHPDGRSISSLNYTLSAGSAYASTGLTPAQCKEVASRYYSIESDFLLSSVKRLFTQMSAFDNDPLKRFIFSWATLEVFIARLFANDRENHSRKEDIDLTEKFERVAESIVGKDDNEILKDIKKFKRIKAARDGLFHGRDIQERDLPANDLEGLIRKYLLAYTGRTSN